VQPEAEDQHSFEHQMKIAREIMDEDWQVLRALADLDRTGECTIDGKVYTAQELRELTSAATSKARTTP
jgi:hypothetical protein